MLLFNGSRAVTEEGSLVIILTFWHETPEVNAHPVTIHEAVCDLEPPPSLVYSSLPSCFRMRPIQMPLGSLSPLFLHVVC